MNNATIQIAARLKQLSAVQRQIKSGAYSEEDVQVLQAREAQLVRIINNLKTK